MTYEVPSMQTYSAQTLQKNLADDLEQICSVTIKNKGDVIITLNVRKLKTKKVSFQVEV